MEMNYKIFAIFFVSILLLPGIVFASPPLADTKPISSPIGNFLSSPTGIGTMILAIAIVFLAFFFWHQKK